jgi:Ca2+/Na+ antiporter
MNIKSPTYKGLIIAITLVIASMIAFYPMHLPENGNSQYVILSLFTIGLVWVLLDKKKHSKEMQLSLKDYFSEGFKAFIVIALLMAVYTFIFYKMNPQILEKGIAENNELIRSQGNKTQAEIQENAIKLRSIFIPMMLMLNTIKFLFLGCLISLTMGGLLSQKK